MSLRIKLGLGDYKSDLKQRYSTRINLSVRKKA